MRELEIHRDHSEIFQVISQGNGAAPIAIFLDDQEVATTARMDKSAVGPYPLGTNTVLLPLAKGNEICLKVQPRPSNLWGDIVNLFRSPSQVNIEGHLVGSGPVGTPPDNSKGSYGYSKY